MEMNKLDYFEQKRYLITLKSKLNVIFMHH